MSLVLFFDDRGGFGPTFNRENAVGGAEMHLVQVAEFLAESGYQVHAAVRGPTLEEGGVYYWPETMAGHQTEVNTLIVVGCASMPTTVKAHQTFAFQVVDPRPHPGMFAHLLGKATMVCVSEWHANLFRQLGHKAVSIPVPIPDEWYAPDMRRKIHHDFGCFSSFNKGGLATMNAWHDEWGTLAVGSPYSHPEYTQENMPRGVQWLGTLRPRERWIDAMLSVGAIARICTIGETFGVVDVAARAMGLNCYTLCTGDVGALREVGARPFTDPAEWREAIRQRSPHPGGEAERFRASRVLPLWLDLLGGRLG